MIRCRSLFDNICEFFDGNEDCENTQVACIYDEGCVSPDTVAVMVVQDKHGTTNLLAYIPIERKNVNGDMKTICDTTLEIQSKYNLRSIEYKSDGNPRCHFDAGEIKTLVKNVELFVKYLTDRFVKMDKDNIKITMLRIVDIDKFENEWNHIIGNNKLD